MESVALWIVSCDGVCIAQRIVAHLHANPWLWEGKSVSACHLFAPKRIQNTLQLESIEPCDIAKAFSQHFFSHRAHIFIGALGIAVRLLAPNIRSKRTDPAVVVVDAQGHFVISVLSGHIGGANNLTHHIATLLEAQAVLTTASDSKNLLSLDLLLTRAKIAILDWDTLPKIQGLLLEGASVALYDPESLLPSLLTVYPKLHRLNKKEELSDTVPSLTICTSSIPKAKNRLRCTQKNLVLGIGCKKNCESLLLEETIFAFLEKFSFEIAALCFLASVDTKKNEPAILAFSKKYKIPLQTFGASELALCKTPNPSDFVGNLFSVSAFSVCESASLLCASHIFGASTLLVPKTKFHNKITLSLATKNHAAHNQ